MTHTSSTPDEASVKLSVDVDVDVSRAFEVFTAEFDRIKPRDHNLLSEDIAETVLEHHVGGRLYDRGVNGAECDWGRVLAFDPPTRLLLAWNISPRWQLETEAARASEVEITFTAIDGGRTRVELEHRHLDRHGDGWPDAKDALAGDEGWPLYLHRFEQIAAD